MALYLIVVQAHFVMNNVFEGMIWFFLPVAMVITNDIFAYVCGMTFGRTPLIKLSPKKTVEGFVGAWIFTVLSGYLFTNLLSRYSYFICPVNVCPDSLNESISVRIPYGVCSPAASYRTSAQTYSPVSTAHPIPSSFPELTTFPLCLRPGSIFHLPPRRLPLSQSPLPPSNSTCSPSQHSPHSLPPSAASSRQVSSAHSTSKTLAIQFRAMVASRIVWTASSSWASLLSCTTRVSSLFTRPALAG